MSEKLVSKVLVLDNDASCSDVIKAFCDQNDLVAVRVSEDRLMSVLGSNIDLGAIFYSASYGGTRDENVEIARRIHALRPELPIFLRLTSMEAMDDVDESIRHAFCAFYTTGEMSGLRKAIDEYIFSLVYPNALVRGISEMTEIALASQFGAHTIHWDTPYVVHDRMIFGEVFSLIPLESSWCRGYMMLQTEEDAILDFLRDDLRRPLPGFREVNSLLGEMTNLIWGMFKNRYIGDHAPTLNGQIQVPLIVNHQHKYASFGTENPQLCFLYTLTNERSGKSIRLYQRFIFNLTWTPEEFKEVAHDVASLVDTGELELF